MDEVMRRLDSAEMRLLAHSRGLPPAGLTEPDEGGTERWEAGQVWAHIAEFVPYWHGQLEHVIAAYQGEPVPFGRTKGDATKMEAIEADRHEPVAALMARTRTDIESLQGYVRSLSSAQTEARGLHPRRGVMTGVEIVEHFIVDHLEEHADQLDGLT